MTTSTSPRVAVVILNWNGRHHLETYLPSVIEHSREHAVVVVVDNGSTDDSITWLKEHHPSVQVVELDENLDEMDRDLVELEQNPKPEDIARIFRTLHTIKGTCGFLGFSRLESVAHASENLLSKLRDGELNVNADIASALLATVDAIRNMMAVIEEEGSDENTADFSDLVKELERLQKGDAAQQGVRYFDGRI